MASPRISQQQLVDALQRVPPERWVEVLNFIVSLQTQEQADSSLPPLIQTAHDLAQSELIGIWAERTDLGDSRAFARQLREPRKQTQEPLQERDIGVRVPDKE